jgi:hypothetical protein
VIEIARRFIIYYWRLTRTRVPQGSGQELAIHGALAELSAMLQATRGLEVLSDEAGLAIGDWIENAPILPKEVRSIILDIRDVVLDMPIKHLPEVRGEGTRERLEFFSLLTLPHGDKALSPFDDYEAHRLAAPGKRHFATAANWYELVQHERTFVALSSRAFDELSEVRFWLRDATVLRWAQYCAERSARLPGPRVVVDAGAFLLTDSDRDASLRSRLEHVLRSRLLLQHCFYTDLPLGRDWQLDHVIPRAWLPVDLFWNLVPATRFANQKKSDRLPALTNPLLEKHERYVAEILKSDSPTIHSDLRMTAQRYFQSNSLADSADEQARQLRSLLESSWKRVHDAGADIWVPSAG